MKIKLKPSASARKRYLLVDGAEKEEIEKIILDYIGILGYAKAMPVFIDKNIIAIEREEVENIRAAIEASGKNIKIRKVSGTLKGLGK